ncbi:MAG: PHP domain-containing protein [Clostridia bacterium]|nr:PHP domain-containing protein [Clostridia bacterium]
MSEYRYDLHVHSCLSPCADDDMTPANIAGMASLNGISLLALTDHNSAKNCPAFFEHCKRYGIVPIPGMELTTSEDVHVICLFPTLESALEMDRIAGEKLIKVKNRPEIFGRQIVVDENDDPKCELEDLIINATSLDLNAAYETVLSLGGVAYPAHIDRQANGIVSILGTFPDSPRFTAYELNDGDSAEGYVHRFSVLSGLKKIVSSDAHHLWSISDGSEMIELCDDPYSSDLVRRRLIDYLLGR